MFLSLLLSVALAVNHKYQMAVYTLVFEFFEPTLPHTFAHLWGQSVCVIQRALNPCLANHIMPQEEAQIENHLQTPDTSILRLLCRWSCRGLIHY